MERSGGGFSEACLSILDLRCMAWHCTCTEGGRKENSEIQATPPRKVLPGASHTHGGRVCTCLRVHCNYVGQVIQYVQYLLFVLCMV